MQQKNKKKGKKEPKRAQRKKRRKKKHLDSADRRHLVLSKEEANYSRPYFMARSQDFEPKDCVEQRPLEPYFTRE
jgi:hypothetical protein